MWKRHSPRPWPPAEGNVAATLADDRYADALVALAALRAPVDEFFDTTMVMDEIRRFARTA